MIRVAHIAHIFVLRATLIDWCHSHSHSHSYTYTVTITSSVDLVIVFSTVNSLWLLSRLLSARSCLWISPESLSHGVPSSDQGAARGTSGLLEQETGGLVEPG